MRLLMAAGLILAMAAPALAQTEVYKRKTIIDLTGQVIEGTAEGPSMSTLWVRKRTRFSNAIVVRDSFRSELLSSAADL